MKRLLLIATGFLLAATVASGQERVISGQVTDSESNVPIPGANITVKGSLTGTATDGDGKFSLSVPTGTTALVVSFVGYSTQDVPLPVSNFVAIRLVPSSNELEEVVISVGRGAQRTIIDNPVPVDNFTAKELATTGQFTFDKALQYRVPSFNTVNTPVNDASTLLDPYELRNLGPSRTLILINGKRKNLSSLLYVQFAPGRGETGADLSGIPTDAIKRVEILRDGASAQYGSDAIAGVMNVILKDKFEYSSLNVVSGVTSQGDGGTYGLSFNSGSNFGKSGYINYTLGFNQTDNAIRSGIVDRPTEIATFNPYGRVEKLADFQELGANDVDINGGLINPGGAGATQTDLDNWNNVRLGQNVTAFSNIVNQYLDKYPTANNLNGTGATSAAKFSFNLGIPVSENAQFYSNAAFVAKKVISNANYRTPYWRRDALLLHVPETGGADYSVPGNAVEAADKIAGNYRGYTGYMPTFEGDLTDYNATLGLKNDNNGWSTDVSVTVGGNQQVYTVNNTVNRSAGKGSPTNFKPGGFNFSHIVGNIDISKAVSEKFNVAFGSEARSETFQIIAGDTASYFKEGSNSFPGIRAENARTNSRFNLGAYLDLTYDVTENFLIEGAVRAEKYSDFGSALVWKLSSRLKLLEDKIVLRGSISTGFRAPTLHQIYAQSTQASFAGATIVSSGLFNNISREAFALGIPKLTAEKSDNITLGVGFNPTSDFSLSLDYYNITISDRIVYSSSITTDDRKLAVPTTQLGRILKGSSVGANNFDLQSVQFFINGIKTQTQGLDVVASYKNLKIGTGKLGINLAGNFTLSNEIIGIPNTPKIIASAGGSILNSQIRSLLVEGRPLFKVIGGLDYSLGNWNIVVSNTMFGPTKFQDLDNGGSKMNNIKQVFSTAAVTDFNIGYAFSKHISASFTVNNLFNVLPSWKLELTGSPNDPDYAEAKATLENPVDKSLLEGFLSFSGRYRILGYNGSQFSQLGTTFMGQLSFKF
ncbi:MAG: TonB-dependent receptor [Cyclobacteriaceae bacterium]|nr:TonB-dependent receptor [Cyclobacteriaceae bacterium]